MSLEVSLCWYEVAMAAQVGIRRKYDCVLHKRADRIGEAGDWTAAIEGALGELAFCKATGRYWSGSVNTFRSPDVGELIQVRTRSRPDYELIVRPYENDDEVFVLVTGECPNYIVRGWAHGRFAKNPDWLKGHGGYPPAYFVPQSELRDIAELCAGSHPLNAEPIRAVANGR